MNKVKYGLYTYTTRNIGDEIQSVAARRFLPRVDYYIDRDRVDDLKISSDETVKLIMNGWYSHRPENWPPKSKNIDPLLISMHVTDVALNGAVRAAFASKKSKKFFDKHAPIGARDLSTKDFFTENGINSYFSGCVTTTLLPDSRIKKKDYIVAVTISDEVYEVLKKRTKRPIIRIDVNHDPSMNIKDRMTLAEFYLYLYQSAHSVITTRLHAALPSLALDTPVLFLDDAEKSDTKRFAGLSDLVNKTTSKKYVNEGAAYDVDNLPKNPTDYKLVREGIEKTCADYTGYDGDSSFLKGKKPADLLQEVENTFGRSIKTPQDIQILLSAIGIKHLTVENDRLEREHDDLLLRIEPLEARIRLEVEELRVYRDSPSIGIATKLLRRAVADKIRHVIGKLLK